jgi:hypothetical protein
MSMSKGPYSKLPASIFLCPAVFFCPIAYYRDPPFVMPRFRNLSDLRALLFKLLR